MHLFFCTTPSQCLCLKRAMRASLFGAIIILFCFFQMNKTLPFLVANVIEILDVDPEDLGVEEVDGANVDLDSQRKGKCAVIKTSTRQTYFLPVIGLVDPEDMKPGTKGRHPCHPYQAVLQIRRGLR